jgi:hypothetical protein
MPPLKSSVLEDIHKLPILLSLNMPKQVIDSLVVALYS